MKNSKQKKKQRKKFRGLPALAKKMTVEVEIPSTLTATGDIDLAADEPLPTNLLAKQKQGKPTRPEAIGMKRKNRQKDLSRNRFASQGHSVPKNYHR